MNQVRDGDGRQADRLHLAVRVDEVVRLDLHLRGLRGLDEALVAAALDVGFDVESELEGEAEAFVVEAREAGGEEVGVFGFGGRGGVGGGDGTAGDDVAAPVGAEVVFGGVEDGDEDFDGAFGGGTGGWGGGGGVDGEDCAGEVADGGDDGGEEEAAVPEAIVGGLVAEDLWLVGLGLERELEREKGYGIELGGIPA